MPLARRLAFLFAVVPLTALAQPPEGERPPRPPREAVDACADKAENETCSFSHRERTHEGTCAAGPRPDLPLACRPDDAPEGGPPPPPREN